MCMRSVLLFAGAGASKAVNPKEYPTTVEFFELLPVSIKQNALFGNTTQYLKHADAKKTIDIERVLWALQELQEFTRVLGDDRTVPGWFLQNNRLGASLGVTIEPKQLFEHRPRAERGLDALISDINTRVYDLYAREPLEQELEANWLPLLRSVTAVADKLEVFTTNYDINIEVALDLTAHVLSRPSLDTGVRGAVQRWLDLSVWSSPIGRSRNDRFLGLFTKLHGSVNWGRGKDKIYVGDPLFKGSHDKHVIEYPGFKGSPTVEPFNVFHSHFATAVATATDMIFIGFAFRYEYINSILERLTSREASVVILNPSELTDLPFRIERIKHLKENVTAESATRILEVFSSNRPV